MGGEPSRRRSRGPLLWGAVLGLALLLGAGLPAAAARPAGPGAALTFTRILGGYRLPVLVTHDGSPRQRLFIVEQTGRIRVARFIDGTWQKAGVFLDLRAKVNDPLVDGSERGLLGLAFHPDYATNGLFYVDYTRKGKGAKHGDTVIAEYRRATALTADPASARILRVIDQPWPNHNGGHLAFGHDGHLYIASGDGGGAGDPGDRGQDPASRLGKILRIDPRDPDGAGPRRYSPAPGNPWIGETEKNAEVWAWGLRNPWRFSFDRLTGDLWIGDVGQRAHEEIDQLPAAGPAGTVDPPNLGWNVCEGDRSYPGGAPCPHEANGFLAPVFTYDHAAGGPADGGCAVIGGYVVRAPDAGAWDGVYLLADVCTGNVSALSPGGARLLTQATGREIHSFGEDGAGRLYVMDRAGTILRIGYTGDPTP